MVIVGARVRCGHGHTCLLACLLACLLLPRFGLDLVLLHSVQHNVVLGSGWVVLRGASAPVVRRGVRQDRPVPVETARWDGLGARLHRLEPLLRVLVPKVVPTR